MARKLKWVRLAEELLEVLPERPDDADPEEDRLDWALHGELSRFVGAANLKPDGVKAAKCRGWPKILADAPVSNWWTQEFLAGIMQVDVRTIRRWEKRGLPSFGEGKSKRFPVPHAVCWCVTYLRMKTRLRVSHLPVEIALGECDRDGSYIGRRLDARRRS